MNLSDHLIQIVCILYVLAYWQGHSIEIHSTVLDTENGQ